MSMPDLLARIGSIVFSTFLLIMPARAANNCPWMNEATASGLVSGDAVGAFVEGHGLSSVCTFTQRAGSVTRTLQIAVEIAADPHARLLSLAQACGTSAAPLPAIGNEALICGIDPRRKRSGERAVGRVRDQVFTITLSSSLKNDMVLNKDELRIKIDMAAEQVAGNLF
jgi:hypothetical protein